MTEIQNAIITGTSLGYEDHGILCAFVNVSGDGWGVGIGGFRLDAPPNNKPSAACGAFVKSFLETLECDSWEKLPGRMLRVKTEGLVGTVTEFGHPIKDKWCNIRAVMESCR